jgi:hypothetical protein
MRINQILRLKHSVLWFWTGNTCKITSQTIREIFHTQPDSLKRLTNVLTVFFGTSSMRRTNKAYLKWKCPTWYVYNTWLYVVWDNGGTWNLTLIPRDTGKEIGMRFHFSQTQPVQMSTGSSAYAVPLRGELNVETHIHAFRGSVQYGGEWSASTFGRFITRNRVLNSQSDGPQKSISCGYGTATVRQQWATSLSLLITEPVSRDIHHFQNQEFRRKGWYSDAAGSLRI